MSFKRRVLSAPGKDVLLEIGGGLELDVTTRMGVEELRDALAKSKRAKPDAIVQESLSRDTLKDSFGAVGLDDTGNEKAALVERILAAGGDKAANGAGYKIDPAAVRGSKFLYVAFRELYRLDTELLSRMREWASTAGKLSWNGGILAANFFGIDINPFAVELAKVTLNIAKKIAFEERKRSVRARRRSRWTSIKPPRLMVRTHSRTRKPRLMPPWPTPTASRPTKARSSSCSN